MKTPLSLKGHLFETVETSRFAILILNKKIDYRLVPEHITKISISIRWQLLSFPQSKIEEKNTAYYYNLQGYFVFVKTSISFKLQLQPMPACHIRKK